MYLNNFLLNSERSEQLLPGSFNRYNTLQQLKWQLEYIPEGPTGETDCSTYVLSQDDK